MNFVGRLLISVPSVPKLMIKLVICAQWKHQALNIKAHMIPFKHYEAAMAN